jgi:hypothetical protein
MLTELKLAFSLVLSFQIFPETAQGLARTFARLLQVDGDDGLLLA